MTHPYKDRARDGRETARERYSDGGSISLKDSEEIAPKLTKDMQKVREWEKATSPEYNQGQGPLRYKGGNPSNWMKTTPYRKDD